MGMVADTVLSLAWGRISAWPGACAEDARPGRRQGPAAPKRPAPKIRVRKARVPKIRVRKTDAAEAHHRGLAAPMGAGPAILDPALGVAMLFRGGKA